jgi:hypothetical protein
MPFRHVPAGQFDLDTMRKMQGAFDVVCERMSLASDDVKRSTLATVIIELAASGEREGLLDKAIEALNRPASRRR